MAKAKAMRVGDLVRVKHRGGGLSEDRYEVVQLGTQDRCLIRQWPGPMEGGHYAHQPFYQSLLVVDNSGPKLLARLLP